MRRLPEVLRTLLVAGIPASALLAQEPAAPPPTPAPEAAEPREAVAFRPLEGNVVINLPSVDVAREGTLTLIFTHRFQQPVQHSDIHDLYSFDNGAHIGIGLGYVPVKNLDLSFLRSSELDVYEAAAKYELVSQGLFAAALRVGEDWRTEKAQSKRSSFFAQAMLALSLGARARVTAVPTYLSRTNGFSFVYATPTRGDESCEATPFGSFICSGLYEHIVNVPVGVSLAVTHSITVHGEVTPRIGKTNAKGVGWVVSVEKSLLRHRFSFTAGNQRHTTVDQYAAGIPFSAQNRSDIFLGFNLIRQWKLK
jgi:Membrane bound beta barrel domain (DUF5777)